MLQSNMCVVFQLEFYRFDLTSSHKSSISNRHREPHARVHVRTWDETKTERDGIKRRKIKGRTVNGEGWQKTRIITRSCFHDVTMESSSQSRQSKEERGAAGGSTQTHLPLQTRSQARDRPKSNLECPICKTHEPCVLHSLYLRVVRDIGLEALVHCKLSSSRFYV